MRTEGKLGLRSFAAFSSWHPWHPKWAASWQCIADEALRFRVPSWGPALLTASAALPNSDFLTRHRGEQRYY